MRSLLHQACSTRTPAFPLYNYRNSRPLWYFARHIPSYLELYSRIRETKPEVLIMSLHACVLSWPAFLIIPSPTWQWTSTEIPHHAKKLLNRDIISFHSLEDAWMPLNVHTKYHISRPDVQNYHLMICFASTASEVWISNPSIKSTGVNRARALPRRLDVYIRLTLEILLYTHWHQSRSWITIHDCDHISTPLCKNDQYRYELPSLLKLSL